MFFLKLSHSASLSARRAVICRKVFFLALKQAVLTQLVLF